MLSHRRRDKFSKIAGMNAQCGIPLVRFGRGIRNLQAATATFLAATCNVVPDLRRESEFLNNCVKQHR